MPEQLSNSLFVIQSEADTNDQSRQNALVMEYIEVSGTVTSNLWTAEVPTGLGEVVGVIGLGYMSTFAAGDACGGLSTDGVITTNAVTVRATTVSIGDGALIVRMLVVGRKSSTVLSLG